MNRFCVVMLVPLLAPTSTLAFAPGFAAVHQEPDSTVLDGVFTQAQARRG